MHIYIIIHAHVHAHKQAAKHVGRRVFEGGKKGGGGGRESFQDCGWLVSASSAHGTHTQTYIQVPCEQCYLTIICN